MSSSSLQFVVFFLLLVSLVANSLTTLPQNEVDVLNEIATTMGAKGWEFTTSVCQQTVGPFSATDPIRNITCICHTITCHVISIVFKRYNLTGVLSSKMVQLPYLQYIDFSKNYLNGSIPLEWASMDLKKIALFGNRLSGSISHLGNITSLTYLDLDINQFSGAVPAEFGKLINLEILRLSSNNFSGNLPMELAELRNLTDFRINNNNLNGSIPDFIQNWSQLGRLEMQGSGLEGPIPSSISVLEKMVTLKIVGINGRVQAFPMLGNMSILRRLVLSNCNISGTIPAYVWELDDLRILDLSFNKLTGKLDHVTAPDNILFLFLTSNFFTGSIPGSLLRTGSNVDLSYNTFNWPHPEDVACTKVLVFSVFY
ncbi:hypothetical protein ACFE04_030275 [Oxalis oulophora]